MACVLVPFDVRNLPKAIFQAWARRAENTTGILLAIERDVKWYGSQLFGEQGQLDAPVRTLAG